MERLSNKAHMRQWVAALRSGEYQQAEGSLKVPMDEGFTQFGYCCLGVACEVAIKDGVTSLEQPPGSIGIGYSDAGETLENSELPNAALNWLGIAAADPVIGWDAAKDTPITAALANDTLHWNFAQIADAIEEYYDLTSDNEE